MPVMPSISIGITCVAFDDVYSMDMEHYGNLAFLNALTDNSITLMTFMTGSKTRRAWQ